MVEPSLKASQRKRCSGCNVIGASQVRLRGEVGRGRGRGWFLGRGTALLVPSLSEGTSQTREHRLSLQLYLPASEYIFIVCVCERCASLHLQCLEQFLAYGGCSINILGRKKERRQEGQDLHLNLVIISK